MEERFDITNLLNIFNEEEKKALTALFALDDDKFTLIAPSIKSSLLEVLNSPALLYQLTLDLKDQGISIDSLIALGEKITEEIAQVETLSKVKADFIVDMYNTAIMIISKASNQDAPISIPIELIHPDAKVPTYANTGDAGLDVYAIDDYTIKPNETIIIPLGFKVAVPAGYELQVRPKSGLSSRSKLRIANTPGTIDSGYRGEVGVIVENISGAIQYVDAEHPGNILYGANEHITKGQKFAQLVLQKVPVASFQVVDSIEAFAGDRGGGFGSTGAF